MDSEKTVDRILRLLAKQMGQSASQEEMAELQELVRQNPEYYTLIDVLQTKPPLQQQDNVNESWDKLQYQLANQSEDSNETAQKNQPPVKKILRYIGRNKAAIWAGLILLAASALWFLWQRTGKEVQPALATLHRVGVPYGMPEKRLLPDSSVVWLNAGSVIHYADDFVREKREVYLEGEAYFDVHHDAKHPFIVHAGNIAVQALGTEFNVQAYPDEGEIETTLIKGKVQITMQEKPGQKIILTPNEKLTVINESYKRMTGEHATQKDIRYQVEQIAQPVSIPVITEVAWLQDKLAFENEAFGELAKKMERRYNRHIVFSDTALKNERLTGVFENENMTKALKLLQMTTPFHFRMQDDSVYVSK